MSMIVEIDDPRLGPVIHALSKRWTMPQAEVVERFLKAGLRAERERILNARAPATEKPRPKAVIMDPCSEQALRQTCGGEWELCWWLVSCALEGSPPPP